MLVLGQPKIPRLTIRRLYSKSGNQCAFPGCIEQNFDKDGQNVSTIAHISAISPMGPRYNPNLSIDERNDISNLLILCRPHHMEIDEINPSNYSVDDLKRMKEEHEATVAQIFDLPDKALEEIVEQLENELDDKIEEVQETLELLESTKGVALEYKQHCDSFLRGFIDVLAEFIPLQLPGIEIGKLEKPFSDISSDRLESIRSMCTQTSLIDEGGQPLGICLDLKNDWKAQQVWFMIGNFWFLNEEDTKAFYHYDFLEGLDIAINPNTNKPVIPPEVFYFNYGFTLETMERRTEAIQAYEKVIAIEKDNYKAWYNISYSYDKLYQWEKALEAATKAVEIFPLYNHGWYGIGTAHLFLGNYEEARDAFIFTLAIDPTYLPAYANLGSAYGNLGELKKEISVYDFVLNVDPSDVNLWINKSVALSKLGKYRAALENVNVALDMDPALYESNYNKGLTLVKMDRPSDALEFLKNAVAIRRTETALHDLATCHRMIGQIQEAKTVYENLIEFIEVNNKVENETSIASIISFATQQNFQELLQKAMDLLKRFFPDSVIFMNFYAVQLGFQGKHDEALEIYEKLLLIDPDNSMTLTNMGETLIRLNRIDEAKQALSKAVQLDKVNSRAWNNLGAAYDAQEELPEALACFVKALTIVPEDTDVLINIGMIYYQVGKLDDALEYVDNALELQPEHQFYLKNKLVVLEAMQDEEKLSEFLEKYPDARENAPEKYHTSM